MLPSEAFALRSWAPESQGALVRGAFQELYYEQETTLEDIDLRSAYGLPKDASARVGALAAATGKERLRDGGGLPGA